MISTEITGSLLTLALDSREATLDRAGGKGASLARLAAAGLPVPPGFIITTEAYRRFVAENGLQNRVLEAAQGIDPGQPASAADAAATIQELFASARLPDAMGDEIRRAYAGLGTRHDAVAVRSSATAEDQPEMSFAGQQETYLNVQGDAEVLAAVKRCWASLWTARAITYRARNAIRPDDVSLAVVVQRLVPAGASGVLFTANPINGARDQVVINAAWGLGESIVGGQVTPDTIVVAKATGKVISREIGDKAVMTVRTTGGTVEAPVPAEMRGRSVLDAAQIAELARTGRRIEELYGRPMDVEWALQGGKLWILQARPITTLGQPGTEQPGLQWTLPRPGGRYARASVIELLPDPLSPLFATLGLPHWNDALVDLARPLGAEDLMQMYKLITINDYAYYDFGLTTTQALTFMSGAPRMLTGMARLIPRAEERWAGEARPAYAAAVGRWESQDLRQAPALELVAGASEILHAAAHHYVTLQSGILPASYTAESLFALVYDRLVRRRGDPPALTFLLGFDSAPIRVEKSLFDLAQWARQHSALAAYLTGTPNRQVVDAWRQGLPPTEELAGDWPEFSRRFTEHVHRFGHTIYDLDFAKPTPADEPGPLLDTLKYFLAGEARNPYARQSAAAEAREAAIRDITTRLDRPRLALFRRLLRIAQRFAPLREDALADAGLGWPVLRRMLAELGRRLVEAGALDAAGDVYWLRADEVQEAARLLDSSQPVSDYRAQIGERQSTWARERKVTPPVALPQGEGMRFLGLDWSSFAPALTDQAHGDSIRGIGTSPGRVTGPARTIHGSDEFDQMAPGDVLVAKITTPAWTPLFVLASGVVTDVGGPLSHGSIVAREYHIPAVLGTGVATERINSGDRITVDGDAGTVMLPGIAGAGVPGLADAGPATPSAAMRSRRVVALGFAATAVFLFWRLRRKSTGSARS